MKGNSQELMEWDCINNCDISNCVTWCDWIRLLPRIVQLQIGAAIALLDGISSSTYHWCIFPSNRLQIASSMCSIWQSTQSRLIFYSLQVGNQAFVNYVDDHHTKHINNKRVLQLFLCSISNYSGNSYEGHCSQHSRYVHGLQTPIGWRSPYGKQQMGYYLSL